MQRHRDELRKQGLRPVQIWVPDTRRPGFADELRRQGRMVAQSSQAEADQAFADSLADWDSE